MYYYDLAPEEFRLLRSKRVSEYFPEDQLSTLTITAGEAESDRFLTDLNSLLKSRQGIQGRAKGREFRKWWDENKSLYLTRPVINENRKLSLSEFIDELYLHFLTNKSKKNSSRSIQFLKRVVGSRYTLTIFVFLFFVIEKATGLILNLVVLGPGVQMVNSYAQPLVTPLAQTASQVGAKDLAPAASVIQSWLTNRERLKEVANDLHKVSENVKRTKFDQMGVEQSKIKWAEFEDAFFKLFLKYNQTLPSHLRDGRAAFKDFMVLTPVGLASNLSTFDTQYWVHRREYDELQEKKRKSGGKTNLREKNLQRIHFQEMEAAENRIAGTLAAWKLFEMMYPEFSSQPTNVKEKSHLQNGYRTFVRSMRFELYVRDFSKQVDAILKQIDSSFAVYEKDQEKGSFQVSANARS